MTQRRLTILVAEDQAGVRTFLATALAEAGFAVVEAVDGLDAIRTLDRESVDLVLTDLRMPGADGLAVLKHAQKVQTSAPVIVLTAYGTIEGAVEAMRAGAYDFLTKPIESPDVLTLTVERALEQRRLRQENEILRQREPPPLGFDQIVRADSHTEEVIKLARAVAPTHSTVLLTGESGTGKEVFARAIHEAGSPGSPFVGVNCAALPHDLLESELFGHEKGAFTGANKRRQGRFELAGIGTLFLDEVGELELSLQGKLLRVLQEGIFERVGGTRSLQFTGRIMAATNQDLQLSVGQGRFREDLYYRINVFPIHVPPLRERPADIMPLAEHFLQRLATNNGRQPLRIEQKVAQMLASYSWPGNVRELANILERATILATTTQLTVDLLPTELTERAVDEVRENSDGGTLRNLEKRAIIDALTDSAGNRQDAAKRLGISLRTLQYRLREYGLTRK